MTLGNATLYHFSSKEEIVTKTIQLLTAPLQSVISSQKPLLLLLSGGSAMTDLLPYVDTTFFSSEVTITILDERYDHDEAINTMDQFKKTPFYAKTKEKGVKFLDTSVLASETFEDFTKRILLNLETWEKDHPDGVMIATMGIGPDGHTAGIMPFPENPSLFTTLFEDEGKIVVGYDAQDKNPYRYRVTVTNPFLKKLSYAVVYAVGENKKEALMRLTSEQGILPETPCRILREMPADIVTDVVV